jgi:hypothetical protein
MPSANEQQLVADAEKDSHVYRDAYLGCLGHEWPVGVSDGVEHLSGRGVDGHCVLFERP